MARHRKGALWLAPLTAIAAVVHGVNMSNAPQRIDDEGTYVAQAWAVENLGALGHYTYWYDHPPLGWLQLAGWTWITGAFERVPNAVVAGREAMLLVQIVSVVLLWVLGRRLGLARWATAVAVAVFALSPLAVQFHRTVYLDNLATPWILGAFVLALSPKRRLAAFAGAGICFAIATLTKETSLLLLPALAWQLWRSSDATNRRYALTVAGTLFAIACAFYVLFATVKGELIPGDDHVSLLDGIEFQLSSRVSSGSVLESGSMARETLDIWLQLDWIGPLLAGVAAVFALIRIRALQPIALGFLILVAAILRPGGYLPVPFIIALLPLGALLIAGVVQRSAQFARASRDAPTSRASATAIRAVPLLALGILAVVAALGWGSQLRGLVASDLDQPLAQSQAWLVENLPQDRRVIVDDAIWVDLVEAGFEPENVVWYYKVDTDPAVAALSPRGWKDYDYVVSTDSMRTFPDAFPQVQLALENSALVAEFGEGTNRVEIRRIVEQPEVDDASAALRAEAGASVAANRNVVNSGQLRETMSRGEVDLRVLSVLAALAEDRTVEVAGFPEVDGEAQAGSPRRVVELSRLGADPVSTNSPAVADAVDFLRSQPAGFRIAEVVVANGDDGRPVLRVVFPIASSSSSPGG